ncbi:hypothetical protein [Moorena sp. SIO3B2]|uniref:hypothetical protein n=1 Tax=Moorena sp. SIO3B2 TaxID=2607827 RepID=UPI0013C89816|nr:hypothetical protein [Moorena sp. SIO3B2]NEP37617.1 hypothetical protein [Moorena sp. SIO3B2]
MQLTVGHATLRKRFGKADATRTQSVAKGLSFRAYAIAYLRIGLRIDQLIMNNHLNPFSRNNTRSADHGFT